MASLTEWFNQQQEARQQAEQGAIDSHIQASLRGVVPKLWDTAQRVGAGVYGLPGDIEEGLGQWSDSMRSETARKYNLPEPEKYRGKLPTTENIIRQMDATGQTTTPRNQLAEFAMSAVDPALLGKYGIGLAGMVARKNPELAKFYHPISGNKKMPRSLDEISYNFQPDDSLVATRPLSIENLQGQVITSAPGDRSRAGGTLYGVDDVEFESPVRLEGGVDFMRSHSPYGTVWASEKGALTTLRNAAMRGADKYGADPNIVYLPMGYGSMDHNTMALDVTLERLKKSKVSKKTKKQFDDEMRTLRPEWVGIDHPDSRTQLDASGEIRKAFQQIAGKAEYEKKGFPDIATTRYAITEPRLIDTPLYAGGHGVSKITGELIENPAVPHSTYNTQLAGEYAGELGEVPYNLLFRDFYNARRELGKPENRDFRALMMSPQSQYVDQELVDTVGNYLARFR